MRPPPQPERDATANEIMGAVLTLQDRVTEVRGEAMTQDAVRQAVAAAIHDAVSDPKLWTAAVQAMQTQAQAKAGGWLLGMMRAAFSKMFLFFAVGLAVYAVGGWAALAALFKTTHQP
jgi:hypothetical protein